ncbi:MAG: competence/damage-inducible protein A [Candidatus Aminicenantia bacterium]
MRAEFIGIGSELLTYLKPETNSVYISQRLEEVGIRLAFKTICGDHEEDIISVLKTAGSRVQLIIITGGLGPTDDDLTRQAVSKFLGRRLIFKEDIVERIAGRYRMRGREMPEINIRQGFVIEGAEVIPNPVGTAPGMWIEENSFKMVVLPGPPSEMIPMFDSYVLPKLRELSPYFMSREILKVAGLTETEVDSKISEISMKAKNTSVSILASPGIIEIHILSMSKKSVEEAFEWMEDTKNRIKEVLGENIFSEGESLEEIIGRFLKVRGETLAVAESCTGGLLSSKITDIPGSSDYYERGFIVYSNLSKIEELGVPEDIIKKEGAVSQQVAKIMARRVREISKTTYGIGITGIAGPTGGSEDKPVGTVHIAVSWEGGEIHTKNYFFGTRDQIKIQSSVKALDMLRRLILKGGKD